MQFKKSCWRIKKTQLSLELSRAYKTSRQQSHSMSKSNTISAQVRRIPVKQGKQNQWKVNHSEEFQRSRNKASKKCTSCGKSPMHGKKDCPANCEETLRSYVPLKENSPKTGRRTGCHTGCHHSGRFQKENEIEGNSLSQLSGTPRSVHQDPWHANILVNC